MAKKLEKMDALAGAAGGIAGAVPGADAAAGASPVGAVAGAAGAVAGAIPGADLLTSQIDPVGIALNLLDPILESTVCPALQQ